MKEGQPCTSRSKSLTNWSGFCTCDACQSKTIRHTNSNPKDERRKHMHDETRRHANSNSLDDETRHSLIVGDVFRRSSHTRAAAEDDKGAASSSPATHLYERLLDRIDKLQERVEELEGEQKRLSDIEDAFDYLNGSLMNTDLSEHSSNHSTGTNGHVTSVRSLPIHLMAAQLRRSLSYTSESSQPTESQKRWSKLHDCYHDTTAFSRQRDLVFLHPEEVGKRDYTVEELDKIRYRPFPSRLFITNIQLEWNTVWLRTRHTDHHMHKSSFIQVRDALKADAITSNPPGAKYALTELLNMCYGMKESDYYSFACTIASAFSNEAENCEFEKSLLMHPARLPIIERELEELERKKSPNSTTKDKLQYEVLKLQQQRSRKRLIQLMDIVFSKLKQKKLLVDDNKDNIYRLVLCMTKYQQAWTPYFYAVFSFYFQVCAASYVALSLTDLDGDPDEPDPINIKEWRIHLVYQNIALAVGTACYGAMVALPEILSTMVVYKSLYRREWGLLAFMDFVVNCILPVSGAICGFLVVLQAGSFLEGVLNAVALIFITEIDDQLPNLLDF